MKLDQVRKEVAAQLAQQSKQGVKIVTVDDVPETGPAHRGLWFQIPDVTAVFADLNGSTRLSAAQNPLEPTSALNHFARAMEIALDRFEARYVAVQGDAVFGLFSGKGSMFRAAACAITMRTLVEDVVAPQLHHDAATNWNLTAGIGIDRGTVLVRRLGINATGQNEVWTDQPVNVAAKLSSLADANQIVVSDRVFARYKQFSKARQQALLMPCSCKARRQGADLWRKKAAPKHLELDIDHIYRRSDKWCDRHGVEFCKTLITGQRTGG